VVEAPQQNNHQGQRTVATTESTRSRIRVGSFPPASKPVPKGSLAKSTNSLFNAAVAKAKPKPQNKPLGSQPLAKFAQQGTAKNCFNCGGVGHISRHCPTQNERKVHEKPGVGAGPSQQQQLANGEKARLLAPKAVPKLTAKQVPVVIGTGNVAKKPLGDKGKGKLDPAIPSVTFLSSHDVPDSYKSDKIIVVVTNHHPPYGNSVHSIAVKLSREVFWLEPKIVLINTKNWLNVLMILGVT